MDRLQLRQRLTTQEQMSESLLVSAVLAFSGGLQDAYTYIVRDGVFANAQTGNIVLMSTNFLSGNWAVALRYLLPVLAFILGVIIAADELYYFKNAQLFHWRQIVVMVQIVIFIVVGFLPASVNLLANMLVSLACAMQVQAFRTVGGHTYASTMCIGNLRSGTEALTLWIHTKQRKYGSLVLHYFGVIAAFALGAGIGGVLSKQWGQRTIWLSCIILLIAFALMEFDRIPKEKA